MAEPHGKAEGAPDGDKAAAERRRRSLRRGVAVFLAAILLALVLHYCHREPELLPIPHRGTGAPKADTTPPPETPVLPPAPDTTPRKRPRIAPPAMAPLSKDSSKAVIVAPDSGKPYIYADPWGGRHFDSVTVSLHCREGCLVLYSFEDSVHFKSYETPFTFRRNTTIWISGVDSLGRQVEPTRIDYVIERNPGACKDNNMPVEVRGAGAAKTICMDVYEWPNREGEFPKAFATWQQAADSCKQAGKRLCSLEEWQAACRGPDGEKYPYAGKYNENHCPAKEAGPQRAGRFPACRSYYGLYDMTGNLWEWTATRSRANEDFFMVGGGNWSAGGEATCSLAKFSFYPNVGYPFVGFRCCAEAGAGK